MRENPFFLFIFNQLVYPMNSNHPSSTLSDNCGRWCLDDVSVYEGVIQKLGNTGFETGSLSPWVRTKPYCNCTGTTGRVCNSASLCRSRNYCVCDGCILYRDQISQQFLATIGQVYVVSFWHIYKRYPIVHSHRLIIKILCINYHYV